MYLVRRWHLPTQGIARRSSDPNVAEGHSTVVGSRCQSASSGRLLKIPQQPCPEPPATKSTTSFASPESSLGSRGPRRATEAQLSRGHESFQAEGSKLSSKLLLLGGGFHEPGPLPGLGAPSHAAPQQRGGYQPSMWITPPRARNPAACVPAWSGGSHRPFCIYFKVLDFVAFFFFFLNHPAK